MDLSFAGCGFLGIYHVGVISCLQKYAPSALVSKICGASVGAFAAAAHLCDGDIGVITSSVLKTATEARKRLLGPFSPTFDIEALLKDGLLSVLPEDAHERVNGKLFISVTRVSDGKNVLLSHFESKEELIQALLASAFIPAFSGWFPITVKGVRYVDGGFSDNLPVLDERTITVSPFRGESDICPKDDNGTFMQGILCSCFIPYISGWFPPSLNGVRYFDGFFSDNLPRLDENTVTVNPFSGNDDICPRVKDRESAWMALLCSAYIPGFSGWIPLKVRGIRYVDGGFSDNLPQLDKNTITVSPFCGEADICPKDFTAGLVTISLANTSIELSRENLYRFTLILFPPPPKVLNRMCQQGFNDALEFLQRNNLINCTRCLAVHSTFNMETNAVSEGTVLHIDENECSSKDHCLDCSVQREEAILDTLPEAVGSILQDAIEKANKGLMNWVFKHKSMKLVSILTLPYIIPVEVVYATFLKFMNSAPSIMKDVRVLAMNIIQLLKALIRTWLSKPQTLPHHHHHHDNNFSCQLAITEFTGEETPKVSGDRQKFDFTIDVVDGTDHLQQKDHAALEEEALTQLALRCAARSVSHLGSTGPSRSVSRNPSRAASRAVSRAVSRIPSLEELSVGSMEWNEFAHPVTDDTFEQILSVTNQQDAVMAYYYMDDNNEMRVTEIFDMSEMTQIKPDLDNIQHLKRDSVNEGDLQSQLESFKDPS